MIRYLTSGESHGQALVGIVEGMPAGVPISREYINHQLWRRQQGYGRGGRMRIESDTVEILSGVRHGRTLGSPIALMIRNKDWPNWIEAMKIEGGGKGAEKVTVPRPGHVDFVGMMKFGFDDIRNVIERASARETAIRVACCTLTRKLLEECGAFIGSHVLSIGRVVMKDRKGIDAMIRKYVKASCGAYKVTEIADKSPVRMLNAGASKKAIAEIQKTRKRGDTVGGIFEVMVTGLPVGVGNYVEWDRKLDGQLAQAVMSIHAVKGVEIGEGFANAQRFGSEVHDAFGIKNGTIVRRGNNAGGLEGGVTTGEMLIVRGAMKPISTLARPLQSVELKSLKPELARYERSDVCAVPACSVIAEAVIAPVLANAFLEKFGGDSLSEILSSYKRYRRALLVTSPRGR